MPKKLPKKEKQLMEALYYKGDSTGEIAEETGIAYYTVANYVSAWRKGFISPTDSEENRVVNQGHLSLYKYRKYLDARTGQR